MLNKKQLIKWIVMLTVLSLVSAVLYKPVIKPVLTYLSATPVTDPLTKKVVQYLEYILELNYRLWCNILGVTPSTNTSSKTSQNQGQQSSKSTGSGQGKEGSKTVKNCECRCEKCEEYENVKVCFRCTCVCKK